MVSFTSDISKYVEPTRIWPDYYDSCRREPKLDVVLISPFSLSVTTHADKMFLAFFYVLYLDPLIHVFVAIFRFTPQGNGWVNVV